MLHEPAAFLADTRYAGKLAIIAVFVDQWEAHEEAHPAACLNRLPFLELLPLP